jgi:hypothetical protein
MTIKNYILSILFFGLPCVARSPHRPLHTHTPEVTIYWEHDPSKKYHIRDSHIEPHPIFSIAYESLDKYKLPPDSITYTKESTESHLTTEHINNLIEKLLQEIQEGKKTYTHFTLIKKKNFSFKKKCGLLILSFKEYPFILKLFIEMPSTFFDYHSKGMESICFFYMAGGANRHVTGLTRIKNRESLLQKASHLEQWKSSVKIPRKWFWTPKHNNYLLLEGRHIGPTNTVHARIPAVYGIVADLVNTKQTTTLSDAEQSRTILQLSLDLDLFVDAHRDNFVFTNTMINGHPEVIILDTEHFPSIVGIKDRVTFNTYFEWYLILINQCFYNCYLRHQKSQRAAQFQEHKLYLWN